MRSFVLLMLFFSLATSVANAAVTVVADSVAANLANRLVVGAPLTGGNIILSGVPVATTLANQSGLVSTMNFGTVNGVTLTMPNPGIMLTNGSILGAGNILVPPTVGDGNVEAAIGVAPGTTFDAASLTFSFTTPPGLNTISLSAIFASNEAIGSLLIKDAAVILVDGVNYGRFANGDPLSNLNAGSSLFAAAGVITGFANVSPRQTIIAPLNTALPTHIIKIAIADHANASIDSAILLSNMQAIATPPLVGGGAVAAGVTLVQGTGLGVAPLAGSADPIAPRLRLIGNASMDLMQGSAFVDPGAVAFDNIDGDLTAGIVVTNSVLINTPGVYTVSYNVSDSSANAAPVVTRTVIVHATSATDVLPPVVTAPADVLLVASSEQGVLATDPALAAFFAGVSAVDNIAVLGGITNNVALPPVFLPVGKTVVTFSAKDAALNVGTAQATITVLGTTRAKPGLDVDLDGIPDSWEMAVFANLLRATAISDNDSDGLSDVLEWELGTNPLSVNSNPLSVSTDSWSVMFANNPSDSDGDGVIDALENASSVLNPALVTGLPVAINSTVVYSIDAGAGNQLKSAHIDLPGAGAAANIIDGFGVLSFRIIVPTNGATAVVRITSSSPFSKGVQFYKVNHAGLYSLIPLANITMVAANSVDIRITDGGPLDLDGLANGVIVDPVAFGGAPLVLGGSGSGGGGCSIASDRGGFDPLMLVMLLLSLGVLIRGRWNARGNR